MEDVEIVDDEDREGEKVTASSDSKFFCTLFMSGGRNIPHYIFRYDSAPLNKHEYFSLRKNWNQLLDGKRTYLRPCRDRPVLKNVFRHPDAPKKTLGCQKPLLELVHESPNEYIIAEKIKILSQHYVLFRRTRRDGSCFYRALLFSYLENLGQMQDSLAEVTRLMECVEMSREKFSRLKWDKAYFLNPQEYLSSVVSEFYHLINSVANGLSSDQLYEKSLEEIMSLRILSFLRLLTEIEMRTQEVYKSFIPEEMNVLQFCLEEVRPLDAEALVIQMRALTRALGIPLRLEVVDKNLLGRAVQVKCLDFFHLSESGKGPLQLTESYHSSSTVRKPLERGGSDGLLSSDGTPLLTLLRRRGHCDILYPQVNKHC
ncbi:ubiquitin thioesterase otubain-like isoform X2 [Brachypodium distachyon]|nr:ubiquitin thioesterase otubain-like isoform X2 [Brachypodium distachyon]|eukprot:XP_014750974.1 ubiquitin thioesterase otubain-like isoform X2 [Brachypodium distachyon]